ncbi:MAG: ASCH domain-containing protein [Phycisphaerales bacterium]|jgi:hypothetical protein|nr:ASCH domain-containing protein [Phycisphaerales bacterium]
MATLAPLPALSATDTVNGERRVRRTHVAIVHARYIDAMLRGEKTIEARLSRSRIAPFGRVGVGDAIWFKASGGAFGAMARAARVEQFEGLTPRGVRGLRARFDAGVRADVAFWALKRSARCATLIWLEDVREINEGPDYNARPGDRRAWFVLDAGSRGPSLRRAG